jgi:GNAT superfamily N-acetyltransferase
MHPAEEIERLALEDLHACVTPELRAELGIKGRVIGGSFVSVASRLPTSAIVINRAIGLGLGTPETEETVKRVVEAYTEPGVTRFFVQVHPEARPATLAQMLEALGLKKARGWQKFARGRDPAPPPRTDLQVKLIDTEHAAASAKIACDGFDLGDEAQPWLALLPTCDRWHVFMAFDGGQPAGTGALFIDGDTAWTDFGATAPAFRQRGAQSALLAARVQFAIDNGCTQVFTCTGEDVPGDPQHSYSNIMRCGFKETYVRANYAPPRASS